MRMDRTIYNSGEQLKAAGVGVPTFDREKMIKETSANPRWVHFGGGNIFRAFPAAVLQDRLDDASADVGVIMAEGFDTQIIDLVRSHDMLTLLVTLKVDGSIDVGIVDSIADAFKLDCAEEEDYAALMDIFQNPSLQMASFTITEKGYSLTRGDGQILPDVDKDFANGPAAPISYMGKVTTLCLARYRAGALPIALVSMDNCSHNGDKLRDAVRMFAQKWQKNGFVDAGFIAYLDDPKRVSFPWTMIDKITPRPDDSVAKMLTDMGFDGVEGKVTQKGSYVAPFVNAEQVQYLIMEDWFPNGRTQLNGQGVMYAGRETVDKVERMKVCTCLNPLHTALAIFGCLLGYMRISDEMADPDLCTLVNGVGYGEGLRVVTDPGVISPRDFIDQVVHVRLPNKFVPDTPQRIACDTSQKLSIRFGETIKAYGDEAKNLHWIPLVLAGWCRYLMGIDDQGNPFEISPDPMLNELKSHMAGIRFGEGSDNGKLRPILEDSRIFGVNLYEVGLGEIIEQRFARMNAGKGAVRKALQDAIENHGK